MKHFITLSILSIILFSCNRTFTCNCNYSIRDTVKESTSYIVKRKNREADCNAYEFINDSSKKECNILYMK
jgi:hypothetical protein